MVTVGVDSACVVAAAQIRWAVGDTAVASSATVFAQVPPLAIVDIGAFGFPLSVEVISPHNHDDSASTEDRKSDDAVLVERFLAALQPPIPDASSRAKRLASLLTSNVWVAF